MAWLEGLLTQWPHVDGAHEVSEQFNDDNVSSGRRSHQTKISFRVSKLAAQKNKVTLINSPTTRHCSRENNNASCSFIKKALNVKVHMGSRSWRIKNSSRGARLYDLDVKGCCVAIRGCWHIPVIWGERDKITLTDWAALGVITCEGGG